MASLRHVRRLHLADDVLPVAVDGVLAYFESGAYRLALQSLAHHVHDGYFAFAQQLLLVDVNLPFLARERILHYRQLVGLRCDVEEADGVCFGDETQLQFLVLLQSAVHLLAQLLIQFVVYLYHSILLSVANLEHAADNYK